MERACPQLFEVNEQGSITEAILDVVIHFPGGPIQRMIDSTIRCPHAPSYSSSVPALVPGVAADSGIQDKLDRYGPNVKCLSFETYGRLALPSIRYLRDLSCDFGLNHLRRGPAQVYHNLRLNLERELLFVVADITLLSLGASSHAACRFAGGRNAGWAR